MALYFIFSIGLACSCMLSQEGSEGLGLSMHAVLLLGSMHVVVYARKVCALAPDAASF
jgi:hypothetical protein